jgi:hypothetical protein
VPSYLNGAFALASRLIPVVGLPCCKSLRSWICLGTIPLGLALGFSTYEMMSAFAAMVCSAC